MEYVKDGPHRGVLNLIRFETIEMVGRIGDEMNYQFQPELRGVDWDELREAIFKAAVVVVLKED